MTECLSQNTECSRGWRALECYYKMVQTPTQQSDLHTVGRKNGPETQSYKHLGSLQTQRDFDICSKKPQELGKGHSRASVSQSREEKKPTQTFPQHVSVPSKWRASYDWDMVTASCRTLSRPLPAQPLPFLNSLLRSLRASHSYSHFPEASAPHSVSAVPNGEGGLVFQTSKRGLIIYQ